MQIIKKLLDKISPGHSGEIINRKLNETNTMKTNNRKYLVTLILVFISSSICSQSDTNQTYYTDDISIDFSSGLLNVLNIGTGKISFLPDSKSVENINKILFISDSIIKVSTEERSEHLININNIEQISVSRGISAGYIFGGVGIGVLAGFGISALIVGLQRDDEPSSYQPNPFSGLKDLGKMKYSGYGMLIGAVIGGIMGSLIPDYEVYDMNKFKSDKKKELERILKMEKEK